MSIPYASDESLTPRERAAIRIRKASDLFLAERGSPVGPILLAHLYVQSLLRYSLLRKVKPRQLRRTRFTDDLTKIVKEFRFDLKVYPWSAVDTLNKCRNDIAHTFGKEIPDDLTRLVESIGSQRNDGASEREQRIREFIVSNKRTPFDKCPLVLEGKEESATAFQHAIVQLYLDVAAALQESLYAISGSRADPHVSVT